MEPEENHEKAQARRGQRTKWKIPDQINILRPLQKSERRPPARLELVNFPTSRAGGRRSNRKAGEFCRGFILFQNQRNVRVPRARGEDK